MSPADRAEWDARRIAERRPRPTRRRSLEQLFSIALDQHDYACTVQATVLNALPFFVSRSAGVANLRAADAAEWRWRRVVVALARVLSARVPHQGRAA